MTTTLLKGIDVASYQPDNFGVGGLEFLFVKATEGTTYTNPKMAKQAAVGRRGGLALGFYHFLVAGNVKAQAAYFVDRCDSVAGDMLVCDWETPPAATGEKAASNAEKDAFVKEVKRLRPGHKVGLYCNRDYWLRRDKTSYAGDFLWIADPGHPAGSPAIVHPWVFHQYAVQGGFDRNVGKFASLAALREWCGYAKPKPPTTTEPAPPKGTAYDRAQDKRLDQLASDVAKLRD